MVGETYTSKNDNQPFIHYYYYSVAPFHLQVSVDASDYYYEWRQICRVHTQFLTFIQWFLEQTHFIDGSKLIYLCCMQQQSGKMIGRLSMPTHAFNIHIGLYRFSRKWN